MTKKIELPLVNLRDVVFYPGMECNLYLGRDFTLQSVRHAKKQTQGRVVVLAQKSVGQEKPLHRKDAYSVGTICKIVRSIEMTDGSIKAVFLAIEPVKVLKSETRDGIRYVIGQTVMQERRTKTSIDDQTKNEALKLLLRWNPEMALTEENSKFDALKREKKFESFLDLALEVSSSSMIGKGRFPYEKAQKKTLKLIDSYILRRQKILEQPNRKKQFSMLLSLLKEELRLELV